MQLIKSLVQGMLVHSMMVYWWPKSLLKKVDLHVRNFFWSGDGQTRKVATVAWEKMCCPFDEGGLGFHDFETMNRACLSKLAWSIKTSDVEWVVLMRARFLKNGVPSRVYSSSSVWLGIKPFVSMFDHDTKWMINDSTRVDFLDDFWLEDGVISMRTNLLQQLTEYKGSKNVDFIDNNGNWAWPEAIKQCCPGLI